MKAAGDRAQLGEALRSRLDGVTEVRTTDEGVELQVHGGDRLLARVVAAAEDAGFEVADLSLSEPSLETVFISLTGKELRD